MKIIVVVAAVIRNDENQLMCVQRGLNSKEYLSQKWEFPGGKIEENESQQEALVRELYEELNIKVSSLDYEIHESP